MGAGIAQVMAAASMEVVLLDVTAQFVASGLKRIEGRLASDAKKGKIRPEEKDCIMGLIKGSTKQGEAREADLVIEAIVEDRKAKGDLFQNLHRLCRPETVFATNTSTLSVTDLASLSGRPDHFLGVHFFNPVHAMKLVEIVPGLDTTEEVVDGAVAAMRAIRKVAVVVQDCPGFLVNRVLLMYITEALLCAEEGVSPEEIDAEGRKAGFPMGPLELSDMVGWDVSRHTMPVLHDAYGERFPVPELVRKLNDAGRLGLKTGKGVYTEGKIDDEFLTLTGSTKPAHPFSIDRCILRAVNEAVYCLQEQVASPEDIDRSMVRRNGVSNDGPLHWADEKGLDWVLSRLEELAKSEGPRFWPHHLLKTYVAGGRWGSNEERLFCILKGD